MTTMNWTRSKEEATKVLTASKVRGHKAQAARELEDNNRTGLLPSTLSPPISLYSPPSSSSAWEPFLFQGLHARLDGDGAPSDRRNSPR